MSFTIVQNSGFYAVVNFSPPSPTITKVGYSPGRKIWIPSFFTSGPDSLGRLIVEPSPLLMYADGNPANTDPENLQEVPVSAFLLTLYGVGCELIGKKRLLGLYEEMESGGVLSQFAKVNPVDFMAFTDAVERYQVKPNGESVDLLGLEFGAPRPQIPQLKFKSDLKMWEVIKFIGLWGMLPYLLTSGGITFEKFVEKLKYWKPDPADREAYMVSTLRPILRSQPQPVFDEYQIQQIIS